jgi:hypothetical protein
MTIDLRKVPVIKLIKLQSLIRGYLARQMIKKTKNY